VGYGFGCRLILRYRVSIISGRGICEYHFMVESRSMGLKISFRGIWGILMVCGHGYVEWYTWVDGYMGVLCM